MQSCFDPGNMITHLNNFGNNTSHFADRYPRIKFIQLKEIENALFPNVEVLDLKKKQVVFASYVILFTPQRIKGSKV